ncbi:hypothetical protein PFTANZ_06644 [Plasmodium falciparum Tanzania (2000708)]|uniref:Uncharacterized protein n=1 Tax=Plasmodium falciparum Tanzania (2000708) TaxID=1036725 RepID=A0A024VVY5_PLAFA|nr:hypothetical protein PFTANZ_06644 [Plasmodium falciparum Tanzania (2000708)]
MPSHKGKKCTDNNYVDNEFLNMSGKNNILDYSLNSGKGYNYNYNYNYNYDDDDDDISIIHVDSMDDLKMSYESISLLNNFSYTLDNSKDIDLNNVHNIYTRINKKNDYNVNVEEGKINISLNEEKEKRNEQDYKFLEEKKDNTIIFDENNDTINGVHVNNDDNNNDTINILLRHTVIILYIFFFFSCSC